MQIIPGFLQKLLTFDNNENLEMSIKPTIL